MLIFVCSICTLRGNTIGCSVLRWPLSQLKAPPVSKEPVNHTTMTENLIELFFSLLENIPNLKEFFGANPSLEGNLQRTFNLAVNDWQVDDRTKKAVRQKMPYHLIQLKELVTHAPKGHNPKENDLLNLWKDHILADPGCSTYLSSIQQENLRQIQQQGFQTLQTQLGNQLQGISEKIDQQSNHRIYSCAKYWDNYARVIDGQKQLPLYHTMWKRRFRFKSYRNLQAGFAM